MVPQRKPWGDSWRPLGQKERNPTMGYHEDALNMTSDGWFVQWLSRMDVIRMLRSPVTDTSSCRMQKAQSGKIFPINLTPNIARRTILTNLNSTNDRFWGVKLILGRLRPIAPFASDRLISCSAHISTVRFEYRTANVHEGDGI